MPLQLVAHAFHDAAALGLPPASMALAAAGMLVVAVVVPARAGEPRLLLADPPGILLADPPGFLQVRSDVGGAAAVRRVGAVVGGLVIAVVAVLVAVVGIFGAQPPAPNLAALGVGYVLLPVVVVVAVVTGGPRVAVPRPPPVAPTTAAALAAPLALTHTLGALGGRAVAVAVGGYAVATLVGRWRLGPGWWSGGDPLCLLAGSVARLSPIAAGAGQRRRQPWTVGLTVALRPAERAVIGVLLAAAIAHSARFLPAWLAIIAGRSVPVTVALQLLLLAAVLALLPLVDQMVRRASGRTVDTALLPVLVALILANDGASALFSLDYAVTLASDPLAQGLDLFGTADRSVGTGLLASPLVWVFQLTVVLLGGMVGAIVQRDLDRRDVVTSRAAPSGVAAVAGFAVALLLFG